MRFVIVIALFAIVAAGCGGPGIVATEPAADGVRAYLAALRADNPKAAYEMLTSEHRLKMTFEQFAVLWKEGAAERKQQAADLQEGLKGDEDLGERANVAYPDGKSVDLMRESGKWRLESGLISRTHAGSPRDAVRIFAQALEDRSYESLIRILTFRRKDGISRQVDAFVSGLIDHLGDKIDFTGKARDRAELRWEEDGMRYKIVLRREDDEWRIDDVHIRPSPATP